MSLRDMRNEFAPIRNDFGERSESGGGAGDEKW